MTEMTEGVTRKVYMCIVMMTIDLGMNGFSVERIKRVMLVKHGHAAPKKSILRHLNMLKSKGFLRYRREGGFGQDRGWYVSGGDHLKSIQMAEALSD